MNIQTKGIACLENTLNNCGLDYSVVGKSYPVNISGLEILKIPFSTASWENDDFIDLASKIQYMYDEGFKLKGFKDFLKGYDESMTDIEGCYVKDSYRNTHASLKDILNKILNGCCYAQEHFQSVLDARATHEYKNTESAFLYKGYYITPCILRSLMRSIWNDLTETQKQKYIDLFFIDFDFRVSQVPTENKVLRKKRNQEDKILEVIANDCYSRLFNQNDFSRLNMLDSFRQENLKGIGI